MTVDGDVQVQPEQLLVLGQVLARFLRSREHVGFRKPHNEPGVVVLTLDGEIRISDEESAAIEAFIAEPTR